MSYLSDNEVEALQASDLSRETPFVIKDVSLGMFSVARHYGAARYNGADYTYNPKTDELIRDDVLKWITDHRRKESLCAMDRS